MIRSNRKVDELLRHEILRLYFKEGLPAKIIANKLGIARFTVLYWVHQSDSPVPRLETKLAGSKEVKIASGVIDLLPFVNPSHLRWVDNTKILLRVRNSRPATLQRRTSAMDFFRLIGFYLAEGSKRNGHTDLQNTNIEPMNIYHKIVTSFVHSEVRVRNVTQTGPRAHKQMLCIGGVCLHAVLTNAIDAILSFLGENHTASTEVTTLGLSFLNGDADGDGSVSRAKQRHSNKLRMQLRITEGKRDYALRLLKVVRRILGVGTVYKPKGRNYYEVVVSLSPQRAVRLLTSGFFSKHREARKRIATKVLDSACISRYVLLYGRFGESPFCQSDLVGLAPGIGPDFIGRSVSQGQILPGGVVRAKSHRGGALVQVLRAFQRDPNTRPLSARES